MQGLGTYQTVTLISSKKNKIYKNLKTKEKKLDSQLSSWLQSAENTLKIKQIKALISP